MSQPERNSSHNWPAAAGRRLARPLRWRKAWRDLGDDRLRTILVVLSMAVGIFAFGGIIGARGIMVREVERAFLASRPASIYFDLDPFTPDLVTAARRWPGVASANGRREIPVRVQVGPNDWNDLHLILIDDFNDQEVNMIAPETGAWPPVRHSLLLERKSGFLFAAEVGSTLLLELPDGRERAIEISGLAHDLNQPPAQVFNVGYAYLTLETAGWLGLPTSYNQLQIRVTPPTTDLDHIAQIAAGVEQRLQSGGREILRREIPEPDSHFVYDFLPALIYLMTALGTLSLLLSSLLITTVLGAILKKQIKQIGIMKAIGARSRDIAGIYVRMVLILGGFAVTAALPPSMIAAFLLARFVTGELNIDVTNPLVEPSIVALQVAIGLFVPLAAALIPISGTIRVTVLKALTDTGLRGPQGASFLVDLPMFKRLPRPVALSLRNTFRQRGRLLLTLFTLALAGAIFMSVMTLRASLFQTLEETLEQRGYDLQFRFGRLYRNEQIEAAVSDLPGVASSENWRVVLAVPRRPDGSDGEFLFLNGLPAGSELFQPALGEGGWLTPQEPEGVVVHNNLLKKEPGLGLGDPLTLVVGERETTWRIIGVTHELQPPIGPTHVYANYEALARALGAPQQSDSLQIALTGHDPSFQVEQQQRLEAILAGDGFKVAASQSAADDRRVFTERFNILTAVLAMMAAIIALVGSLSLAGALTINVIERRREIGVLRAIGGSDRAVLQIFIVEGLVIGLLAWVGGLVIAQPLSRLLSWQLGITFLGIPLIYSFAFWGAALWLFASLVLSFGAAVLPARKAIHLKVREALAYE